MSDRHKEKAREIGAHLDDIHFNSRHASWLDSAVEIVATALAEEREAGRREGMRRAAEIAGTYRNRDTGYEIECAILAEAGIAVTD